MSLENPFGDMMHLLSFRTTPESYQILLDAVLKVVTEREILMPITPADIFQRHEFLGGKQKKLKADNLPDASREMLRELYDSHWKTSYTEALSYRLVREFLRFAVSKGDAFNSPAILLTGDEIEGFILVQHPATHNPRIGKLRFYSKSLKTSFKKGDEEAKDLDALSKQFQQKTISFSYEHIIQLVADTVKSYYNLEESELFGGGRELPARRAKKMVNYILTRMTTIDQDKVSEVFDLNKAHVTASMSVFDEDLSHSKILQEELTGILASIIASIETSK